MQLHKLKPDESRDDDGKPIYLTPEGIEKLQNELAKLKARVPDAAGEAARTAAYGDRSDNAEYKQAKGALRRMHYRIFEIETQLKHAVAIKVDASAIGIIQLGSTVFLEVNAQEKKFQIVGPDETDPTRGRISYLSPLGSALLKHKKDDVVEIKTAAGVQKYRVIEIR
jgi:transcription elongation GreA/GreB family factor